MAPRQETSSARLDDVGQRTVRAGRDQDLKQGDRVWVIPDPRQVHRFDSAGLSLKG